MNDTYNKNDLHDVFQFWLDYYIPHRNSKDLHEREVRTDIAKESIPNILKSLDFLQNNKYSIKGTYQRGGDSAQWINWVIIKSNRMPNPGSASSGQYVDYLSSDDGKYIYLGFSNSSNISLKNTKLTDEEKTNKLNDERRRNNFQHLIASKLNPELIKHFSTNHDDVKLGSKGEAPSFTEGLICWKEYKTNEIPTTTILIQDLKTMVTLYEDFLENIYPNIDGLKEQAINMSTDDIKETPASEQMHNKIDLLKFNSYLRKKGMMYEGNVPLNFIAALRAKPFVLLAGISGTGKTQLVRHFAEYIGANQKNGRYLQIPVRPDWTDSSDLFGHRTLDGGFIEGPALQFIEKANKDLDKPYILCLDEMNLARVEYYFSDFLSIIETRRKEESHTVSDPIVQDIYSAYLKNKGVKDYNDRKLILSDNIYIIGTVNMDESTFPFSKKVLDRAMTIELSEVDLSMDSLYTDSEEVVSTENLSNEAIRPLYVTPLDIPEKDRERVKEYASTLENYNRILSKVHLHVGYRVRNEIIYYALYATEMDKNFDWLDYGLMQKVLPRVQGGGNAIRQVLIDLYNEARGSDIEADDKTDEAIEKDLSDPDKKIMLNTAVKIRYMLKRLSEDGYTAYWL